MVPSLEFLKYKKRAIKKYTFVKFVSGDEIVL
jgi:hypothetical protein